MQQLLELQYAGKINGINSTSRVNDYLYFGGGTDNNMAYFLMAPETATITELGMPWRNIEGTPGQFRYELRNVTDDGRIGMTVYAYTANISSGDLTICTSTQGICTVKELVTSYQVQAGQYYSIVAMQTSGTWNSSNRLWYAKYSQNYQAYGLTCLPYLINHGGGEFFEGMAVMGTGTKFYGNAIEEILYNDVTGGSNWYGNKITIPTNFGASVRCVGFKTNIGTDATFNAAIYNTSGTQLVTKSFEINLPSGSANNGLQVHYFDSPVTLTAGTNYYILINPIGNCRLWYYSSAVHGAKSRSLYSGNFLSTPAGVSGWSGSGPISEGNVTYPINLLIDNVNPGTPTVIPSITAGFGQGFN